MDEAIKVLEHAEAVLQKRINEMKDGSPMWSAKERLGQIKDALKVLKHYEPVHDNWVE